jgi:hypothetical protein
MDNLGAWLSLPARRIAGTGSLLPRKGRKDFFHRILLGNISLEESEAGPGFQAFQSPLFQAYVIGWVQIVQPHHLRPSPEQQLGHLPTDKPCRPGN